ncbi:MAG: hypothetical protein ACJ8F7_21850 [Gemmataceae bacterium]
MRSGWLTLSRRFALLVALMFWQGGFTFYGAVVVPVGASVLGSELSQGFITREVTNYLNAAGVVALALWTVDLATERGGRPGLRRTRWPLWLLLAAALAALLWLHTLMDAHFPLLLDRRGFRALHRTYLVISTAQWAVSLMLLAYTLHSWMKPAAGRASEGPPLQDSNAGTPASKTRPGL